MNRKILIAVTLIASSAYIACGGGSDSAPPPVTPAAVDSSSATTSSTSTTTTTTTDSTTTTTSAMPAASTPPPAPKSLYDRLGGKDAIGKVVDTFLGVVAADKRINKRFAKDVGKDGKLTDQGKKLRDSIVEQLTALTGGDATYKGKDMKAAHKGMKITEADFTAFVEDLVSALKTAGVSDDLQGELLKPLAAMHDDVVEVPAKAAAPAMGGSTAPKKGK
jgi:hemoglobin